MAGSKRINLDNAHSMDGGNAISLINNYFEIELPELKKIKEYNDTSGYWGLTYGNESVNINLESGRGFLEWHVEINGKKIALENYNEAIAAVEASSKINIEFVLGIIKEAIVRK